MAGRRRVSLGDSKSPGALCPSGCTRYRVPLLGHVELLGHIDLNTGVPVRKAKRVRYERVNPGDLVHVDVKKLGRIPDGGGHRTLGRAKGKKNRSGVGYSFLHSAVVWLRQHGDCGGSEGQSLHSTAVFVSF